MHTKVVSYDKAEVHISASRAAMGKVAANDLAGRIAALEEPVQEACPASILRTHESARIYLDRDSASGLTEAI